MYEQALLMSHKWRLGGGYNDAHTLALLLCFHSIEQDVRFCIMRFFQHHHLSISSINAIFITGVQSYILNNVSPQITFLSLNLFMEKVQDKIFSEDFLIITKPNGLSATNAPQL